MKLNFLYTKLQLPPEPLIVRYCPQISVFSVLCPQLDLLKPPPEQNSWGSHCVPVAFNMFATKAAIPIDVIPVFRTSHRPSSAKDKFVHRLHYVTLNVVAESASQLRAVDNIGRMRVTRTASWIRRLYGIISRLCKQTLSVVVVMIRLSPARCAVPNHAERTCWNSEAKRPTAMWETWVSVRTGQWRLSLRLTALASSWHCGICVSRFESSARMLNAADFGETKEVFVSP